MNRRPDIQTTIETDFHKYLEILQRVNSQIADLKDVLLSQILWRLKLIQKSHLLEKKERIGLNMFVTPYVHSGD